MESYRSRQKAGERKKLGGDLEGSPRQGTPRSGLAGKAGKREQALKQRKEEEGASNRESKSLGGH